MELSTVGAKADKVTACSLRLARSGGKILAIGTFVMREVSTDMQGLKKRHRPAESIQSVLWPPMGNTLVRRGAGARRYGTCAMVWTSW